MKFSKKIFSLMLLVIFVITNFIAVPVSAAGFSDVANTETYAESVEFLSSLGVINGYEDGTFRPLNNVTRAEFTAMLMRYRGFGNVGDLSLENPPFPDVTTSDVSWAIGNIRTAQTLGIINGYEDGTFRPNNNVLFEEAVKMIICAIGYDGYSPEGASWFSKYITTATKIGILKGADGGVGVPATRACIAQLLFNCNDVEVAENGNIVGGAGGSVLDTELNLLDKTGIIYSNEITSLSSPDINLRDDELIIYDVSTGTTDVYSVKNAGSYANMIGHKVDIYYSYDRESTKNVVSSISSSKYSNKKFTIDAADIIDNDTTATNIAYYDEAGDEKSVSISADCIVVYNDKLYGANSANSTFANYLGNESLPVIGNIELLENSGDRAYDVLFINSYDVYFVSSATRSGSKYTITDNLTRVAPNNTKVLQLDDSSYRYFDKNNNSISSPSISSNNVLCIKESNTSGEKITTVVICKDSVNGEIKSATSGKRVKINSTSYDFSYAAPWMISGHPVALAEPKMGDSGTYYLDLNGDIVAYDKAKVSSNQQYAYVINASVETESMESILYLKLFTQNNGYKMIMCDEKTKINGDSDKTADEIKTILQSAAAYQGQSVTTTDTTGYSQMIKVSTKTRNGNEVIDEIITIDYVTNSGTNGRSPEVSEVIADELQMSSYFVAQNKTAEYSSGKLKSSNKSANIGSSFIVSVPNKRSDEKAYKKVSASRDLENGQTYKAEVYDLTTAGTAKAVVLYELSSQIGAVTAKTPTFVVTYKEQVDRKSYKLIGYSGANKETSEIYTSEESFDAFSQVEIGDVIRVGKDGDGNSTLDVKDILYGVNIDRNSVISNYVSGGTLTGQSLVSGRYNLSKAYNGSTYRMIWGYVYACDGDNFAFNDKKFANSADADLEENTRHDIATSKFSNTLFLKYTGSGQSFEVEKLNGTDGFVYEEQLKSFPQLAKGNEPQEIFIYTVDDNPILVIFSE